MRGGRVACGAGGAARRGAGAGGSDLLHRSLQAAGVWAVGWHADMGEQALLLVEVPGPGDRHPASRAG
jgi:hypothetical protein